MKHPAPLQLHPPTLQLAPQRQTTRSSCASSHRCVATRRRHPRRSLRSRRSRRQGRQRRCRLAPVPAALLETSAQRHCPPRPHHPCYRRHVRRRPPCAHRCRRRRRRRCCCRRRRRGSCCRRRRLPCCTRRRRQREIRLQKALLLPLHLLLIWTAFSHHVPPQALSRPEQHKKPRRSSSAAAAGAGRTDPPGPGLPRPLPLLHLLLPPTVATACRAPAAAATAPSLAGAAFMQPGRGGTQSA